VNTDIEGREVPIAQFATLMKLIFDARLPSPSRLGIQGATNRRRRLIPKRLVHD